MGLRLTPGQVESLLALPTDVIHEAAQTALPEGWPRQGLLIRTAVEHSAGRIPIVAGTGANSTREAIELTAFARKAGASMTLTVVPYYNKPSQEGLFRHYSAIANASKLPLML